MTASTPAIASIGTSWRFLVRPLSPACVGDVVINPPIRVDRILSRRRGDYRQDLPASPENAATAWTAWTAYCKARDLDAGQVTAALGPTAAVAVDPGTHTVYVANGSDGTVSVAEPAHLENVKTVGAGALFFAGGDWTYTVEHEAPCSYRGSSRVRNSATYPLPQPLPDPIALLTGHGRVERSPGTNCISFDYDEKFERTGD